MRTSSYKIPLEELLVMLKASGYELTIEQILEVQSTLLSSSLSRLQTAELKYIITPIIAKNEEEQQDIYRIIDAYVVEKLKRKAGVPKRFWYWLYLRRRWVLMVKMIGFSFFVAIGIMVYVLNNKEEKKPPSPPRPLPQATQPANNNSATTPATPNSSVSPGEPTPAAPVKANTVRITSAQAHGPIIPERKNNNLQISLIFGFLMGAILFHLIFYERKRRMDQEKRKRREESIFGDPERQPQRIPSAGYETVSSPQPVSVQFSDRNYLIPRPAAFQKIKSHLKRPAPVGQPYFDVKKSIGASVDNAGYASPVFTNEFKDRKYIIICSQEQPDSHISHLLHYIASLLGAALTPVPRYTFKNDITNLEDQHNNTIYLRDLLHHYTGYHLLLLADGHSFFDAGGQLLRHDLHDLFKENVQVSLITPVALPDWGYKEAQLQNQGLRVVPADIPAIELLSNAIADNTLVTKDKIAKKLPGQYGVADIGSVQALRTWLNNDQLFELVCALAVYPSLHWPLTLALYDALAKRHNDLSISYEHLLKLTRIPWLHQGELDETVRLQLLNNLKPETEIMARETIIGMLEDVERLTPRSSKAYKELQTQYAVNAFFLYTHDQVQYHNYAGVKDVIVPYWDSLTEWALKEHINSKGNSLLPAHQMRSHATVEDFVLREKEFDRYNVTLSKIAILLSPAILLYILFFIFKPSLVYPEEYIDNVSFNIVIHKDEACTRQLTRALVTVNGLEQTQRLFPGRAADTIAIKDIPYSNFASIELFNDKGLVYSTSVPATDSFFVFNLRCPVGDPAQGQLNP